VRVERRMVRLLVRKSLLSAWTSSRSYGRRRTGHHSGRCVHRRHALTDTDVLTAGPQDIRLDVLFCCCDASACCSCCVTDEECQGNLPPGHVIFLVCFIASPVLASVMAGGSSGASVMMVAVFCCQ